MSATSTRLVRALAGACRINGKTRELVRLLGKGDERDNLAALEGWVRRQLQDPPEAILHPLLNGLVDRLEPILSRVEGEQSSEPAQ